MLCGFFVHRAIFKNENLHLSIVPKPNPIIDEFCCNSTNCSDVSDVHVYVVQECLLYNVYAPRHSGL